MDEVDDPVGGGAAGGGALDPLALAREWFPANDDPDRPQITLATTSLDGYPSARTVLLTEVTPAGFAFHTDVRSSKVAEIEADARVCLVVKWPDFFRQLVIQGVARVQSPEAIAAAYAQRSPYLKHLAWLSDAEFARLPLEERRALWAAAEDEHPDGPPSPSATWIGFEVVPERLVFWESAQDTASRRTRYTRAGGGWRTEYLPG
ncbi:MAG: hypothetical protein RI885_1272 [Actinomycetota bacterium]